MAGSAGNRGWVEKKGSALTPRSEGEAGAAVRVCALAGAALPRRVQEVVGVVEAKYLARVHSGVTAACARQHGDERRLRSSQRALNWTRRAVGK